MQKSRHTIIPPGAAVLFVSVGVHATNARWHPEVLIAMDEDAQKFIRVR